MIVPRRPSPEKIEKILKQARQECISEVIFYLKNDIPYDAEHITCMMVYHIVGKIPRYTCIGCKEERCSLHCFRNKLCRYIDNLPPVDIEKHFPTLRISGDNVFFRLWTQYDNPETVDNFLYKNISMSICLPKSDHQRILYDEFKLSPEAIPIIDNNMVQIRGMVPDIIFRALSSYNNRKVQKMR